VLLLRPCSSWFLVDTPWRYSETWYNHTPQCSSCILEASQGVATTTPGRCLIQEYSKSSILGISAVDTLRYRSIVWPGRHCGNAMASNIWLLWGWGYAKQKAMQIVVQSGPTRVLVAMLLATSDLNPRQCQSTTSPCSIASKFCGTFSHPTFGNHHQMHTLWQHRASSAINAN